MFWQNIPFPESQGPHLTQSVSGPGKCRVPAKWHLNPSKGLSRDTNATDRRQTTLLKRCWNRQNCLRCKNSKIFTLSNIFEQDLHVATC